MIALNTLVETAAAALAVAAAWHAWRHRTLVIVTVIDGDTYVAADSKGRKMRLRLKGCDCPELSQPLGIQARDRVRELILRQWVNVRLHGRDRYRRHLVSLKHEGKDLCSTLVREGLAFPLGGFSAQALLARLAGKGVWGLWNAKRPWQAASRRRGWFAGLFRRRRRS